MTDENGAGKADSDTGQALAMLSAFASVGARAFHLTIKDSASGRKVRYAPDMPLELLRRIIPRLLDDAERNRHDIIIRPRCAPAAPTLIQLDDLAASMAERLAAHALIVYQTSPGNYQAWVAVEPAAPEEFRRRLIKGTGADIGASGSTRITGSRNWKPDYAPAFPIVTLTRTNAGNVTTMAALENAGFAAAPQTPRTVPTAPAANRRTNRQRRDWWPSYERCLQGAPKSQSTDAPDISRVDFLFCRMAYQKGRSVDEIAARLTELSEAAKKDGPAYVKRTVQRAAASVDRESQPLLSRSTPDPR